MRKNLHLIFAIWFALFCVAPIQGFAKHPAPGNSTENLIVNQRPSFDWGAGNILFVKSAGTTYRVTYNGRGFPSGTVPSATPLVRPNGTVYQISYMLINGTHRRVTMDMVTVVTGTLHENPDIPPGVIPNRSFDEWVKAYRTINIFPTGTADIVPAQNQALSDLAAECKKDQRVCILIGTVSPLELNSCYVTPNPYDSTYFATNSVHRANLRAGTARTDAIKMTGNRVCNQRLAIARAKAVYLELIRRGVPKDHLFPVYQGFWGIEAGGNLINQSVVSLIAYKGQILFTERETTIPYTPPETICPSCPELIIIIDGPCIEVKREKIGTNLWKITVLCFQKETTRADDTPPPPPMPPPPPPLGKKEGWYCKRHPVVCTVAGIVIVGAIVVGAGGACGQGANEAGNAGICPPWVTR